MFYIEDKKVFQDILMITEAMMTIIATMVT